VGNQREYLNIRCLSVQSEHVEFLVAHMAQLVLGETPLDQPLARVVGWVGLGVSTARAC